MDTKRTIQFGLDIAAVVAAVLGAAEIIPRAIGFGAAAAFLTAVLIWNGIAAVREKRRGYGFALLVVGIILAGVAITFFSAR